MKLPWIRAGLVSAFVLGFLHSGTHAFANWGHSRSVVSETVLGVPTSYVLPTTFVDETSYVVPTTYVYPTAAYYTPTSYAETSYLLPTAYTTAFSSPSFSLTPTAYVAPAYTTGFYYRRPGLLGRLFGRRTYVATSASYYVPSSFVATSAFSPTSFAFPTVYDFPVATTAMQTSCCGTTTSAAAVQAPASASPATRVRPSAPTNHRDRSPSSVIESSPSEPELEETPPATNKRSTAPPDTASDLPMPPGPVPPEKDELAPAAPLEKSTEQPTPPPAAPAPAEKDNLKLPGPVIPPNDTPPADAKGAVFQQIPGDSRHVTNRPRFYTPVSRASRSLLEGTVIDSESQEAEEGVRVILSNRSGAFTDRILTTNNLGQYAVRLPDGDWTVKVTMPSGRVYAVSELTISNGKIVDDRGRDIPSLTIRR